MNAADEASFSRTIVAQLPVILFTCDRRGVFTRAEGAGLAALGARPGEAVGQSVFDRYRDAPQVLANIRRALTGDAFTAVVPVGGAVFETHYEPLRDRQGAVAGVRGVALDISARWQAEMRFRSLFAGVEVPMAIADRERRLLDCNLSYEWLTGYRAAELRGRRFPSVTHPDDAAADLALWRELMAGRRDAYQLEKRYLRKDSRTVWGHLSMAALRDPLGTPQGAVGVVRDLTPLREMQDESRRCQATLQAARDLAVRIAAADVPGDSGHSSGWTEEPAGAGGAPGAPDLLDQLGLTVRERQTLFLVEQGLPPAQIAKALSVQQNTVYKRLSDLYAALGVHSLAEAIIWTRDHGFGGR